MSTTAIEAFKHKCERCGREWISKLLTVKHCAKCGSPYWNKPRMTQRYPQVRALQSGQSIIVPWPASGPYEGHPVTRLVKKLGLTVEWKADGAHIFKA